MRKSLIFITTLLAVVACSKEQKDIEKNPAQEKPTTLIFTSERPQLSTDTKTQWNGSTIVWSSGDKIRVGYTLDGTWMAKSEAADFNANPKVSAKFYASNNVAIDETNASIGTFTVPSGFTNEPSGDAVFYGVYPSTRTSEDSNYAPSLTITIPSTQIPVVNDNIASFDKTADILVGKSNEISLSGSFPTAAIDMNWTRVVAHADLTFKNLASTISNETIQSIKLTAGENEFLTGSTYINVGTGAITTNNYTVNTVTLDGSNLSVSNNQIEAWACILPVTLTSLTVDIETDAAHYIKSFTEISKQFKANARNTLGISMSGATKEEKEVFEIANGNYVIAALSSGTYYAISSQANGNSARRDRSAITTANFDPSNYSAASPYTAANNLIWTITNVSGGVNINLAGDTDSYMQYSAGNNTLPLGTTPTTFAVSSEESGTYRFTPATGRVIAMNGSNGFACYQTSLSGGVFDLYLIPAAGTPSLTFTETSKSVSATTTSVAFEYESRFLSANPTVTVTEDNGNAVASTSVANNKVTITLNENTTASNKTIKLKVTATGVTDVVLTITQFGVVPPAVAGDVLWSEDFSDVTVSSGSSTTGNPTCNILNVYGKATVSYAYSDNGSNKTLVYGQNSAGGAAAPELLIGKKANTSATVWGVFTASDIPTGGFNSLTLTYISNGALTLSTSTTGVSFGSVSSNGNSKTVVITNSNTADYIDISFENQTTGNVRIDDIVLVAGAPVAGIEVTTESATSTSSSTGTTATLNGTISLVNGADIANVDEAGFYYKLSSGSSYNKVTLNSAPSTTSFSYALTGLTKNSGYTYYAYAIYDGGSEVTGELVTFTPTQSGGGSNSVVLIIDGSELTTTATTGTTTKTYSGVDVVFSDGAKQQTSTGDNKFTGKAILIGKNGKNIHATVPGTITKFEIYANKGASASVSVGVNFSSSAISSYNANASNTFKATLSTLDHVYDCSSSLPSNANSFWYQVTNSNNSQVEFRITYTPYN
ncbi:MAG: hypothetical protein J6T02_04355 [Bacteroidales bacterium]|nr:hypothetical protein [Bacteroidales bacterium]